MLKDLDKEEEAEAGAEAKNLPSSRTVSGGFGAPRSTPYRALGQNTPKHRDQSPGPSNLSAITKNPSQKNEKRARISDLEESDSNDSNSSSDNDDLPEDTLNRYRPKQDRTPVSVPATPFEKRIFNLEKRAAREEVYRGKNRS